MTEDSFEYDNNYEINPEDVENEFNKAIDQIPEAYQLLIDCAQFTGYFKQVLTACKTNF